MSRFIDLTGMKFGEWTVIEKVDNEKEQSLWKCRCECGNERNVSSKNFKSGTSTNCGCLKRFNFVDITGQKFGRLTVIRQNGRAKLRQIKWLCECECGNLHTTTGSELRKGHCTSCGCYQKESVKNKSTTHGKSHTRIYNIYMSMKYRCNNKNGQDYKDYGARGIQVCKEWSDDFMNFYNWTMANGYNDELSIDRIDVNGNYEPSNCRWATDKQQANNKTSNFMITFNNKTQNAKQWEEETKIKRATILNRLKIGWSIEKALTTPVQIGRW